MSTWYANSSTGNDSTGNGSIGTPWLTLAHTLSQASSGDTINLEGTFAESNSPTIGVTIQSYGAGQATVNGGASPALTWTNPPASPITLNNLIIESNVPAAVFNTNFTGTLQFLVNDGGTHASQVTVNGCTVSGNYEGILVYQNTSGGGRINNVLIENTTVSGSLIHGILTHSFAESPGTYCFSNIQVANCYVNGIPGQNTTSTGAYAGGSGIVLRDCDATVSACTVSNCYVNNCGSSAAGSNGGGPVGIFFVDSTGYVITGCVATNMSYGTVAIDGGGIGHDLGTVNGTIEYCVAANCQGQAYYNISASGGNVIRFCLGANTCTGTQNTSQRAGIYVGSNAATSIYNNTIVNWSSNSQFPALYLSGSNGAAVQSVYNNWLCAPAGIKTVLVNGASWQSGLKLDYNVYQSGVGQLALFFNGTTYKVLANWTAATNPGVTDIHSAVGYAEFYQPRPVPAFFNGSNLPNLAAALAFSPLIGSVAANGGLKLSTVGISQGSQDLLGNSIADASLPIGAISVTQGYPDNLSAAVIPLHPIFWYRLNETSGNLGDTMCSMDDAVGTSLAYNQSALLPGIVGGSIGFNGSSSKAVVPFTSGVGNGYTGVTQATVAAYIKPTTLPATARFFEEYEPLVGFQQAALVTVVGNFRFAGFDPSASTHSYVETTNASPLATSATHMLAGTWTGPNATTAACILDGVSQAGTSTGVTGPASINFKTVSFGTSAQTAQYNGLIGPTFAVPTALTAAQLLAVFQAGTFAAGTSTVGTITNTSIAVSSTSPTGGSGSYTYQWQISTDGISWSSMTGTGTTTLSAVATGLISATLYYLRLRATDGNSYIVYTVPVTASTSGGSFSYSISGSATGNIGVINTYTVTPSATIASDTISISVTGGSGTLNPASLVFTSSSSPQTFTFTPSASGLAQVTLSSSDAYPVSGSPFNITVSSTEYALSGPVVGAVNAILTYTVTPVGKVASDTISITATGVSGTLSTSLLTFTNSSAPQFFTFRPTATGTATITLVSTNTGSITGSPLTLSVVSTIGYTLTGPALGTVGAPVTFIVQPQFTIGYDTVSISSDGATGTLSNTSLIFFANNWFQYFTFTPTAAGTANLTVASANGYTVAGSPFTFTSTAVNFILTGPSTANAGTPVTLTLTPAAATIDTITPSVTGVTGTFVPNPIPVNGSAPLSVVFTATSAGTASVSMSSLDGGTVTGSPLTITCSTVNYTLTGPTAVTEGFAAKFTITPATITTDSISWSDGGKSGIFTPNPRIFAADANAHTVGYAAATTGSITVTPTSANGATFTPSSLTVTSSAGAGSSGVASAGPGRGKIGG